MILYNSRFKKLINKIHLWIGLGIGLIFFVIALSGSIITWGPEITRIIYKQDIEPMDKPFVSVSALKSKINNVFPEGDFRTVLFQNHSSTVNILLYAPGTYYYAFMNPYTGELVHLQDMKTGWYSHLVSLHRNLLLGDIGRNIVHWVTLLTLFMLITGIVLWWPNKKTERASRFKLKWNVSPKILNYDLHNVLAFYASWVAIFIVVTGLFWGFEFIRSSLRSITQEDQNKYDVPISNENGISNLNLSNLLDSLAISYQERYDDKLIRVDYPHGKTEAIHITIIDPDLLGYNTDHHYFDRYTGKRINGNFQVGLYSESSSFNILNGLVYDIHFGRIGGFAGRFLVFLTSLIMASLPITGFIIWFGRRNQQE